MGYLTSTAKLKKHTNQKYARDYMCDAVTGDKRSPVC